MASLLRMAGLDGPGPDVSTLGRRQTTGALQIPFRRAGGSPDLRLDRTGVTRRGDGERRVRRHGPGRRQWRKGPPARDPATGDRRAVELPPGRTGDRPGPPDLLGQVPGDDQIGTLTAEGAVDTRRCHTAISGRGATALRPIRRNGRLRKENRPAAKARKRNPAGDTPLGASLPRTRWSGAHARRRGAAQMRRLRAFGERIASRDPDRQTAGIQVRVALPNRLSAPGTAEIPRAA